MYNKPAFTILSAELSTLGPNENASRTKFLELQLRQAGADYAHVSGVYRGTAEASFIVFHTPRVTGAVLRRLAYAYEQESVLEVSGGARRVASLVYLDDEREEACGEFQRVDDIDGLDAYTEASPGLYYACVAN